ncbi:MAG: penicillin-binding protein 2 [Proteobacteria bacterium]|nr:penicillin-binding protein 2 [Pseudomonadota bacterium]
MTRINRKRVNRHKQQNNRTVNIHARFDLMICLVLLLAATVLVRVYFLQKIQFDKWSKLADKQHQSSISVHGARGNIVDSSGRMLAASIKSVSVGIHPSEITNPKLLASSLSPILQVNEKQIIEKIISEKEKKFVWLAKGLALNTEEKIKQLRLEGVAAIQEFSRLYPQNNLAETVIGRVGVDGEGLSGIELSYQKVLAAPNINLPVRRDARGRLLTPASFGDNTVNTKLFNNFNELFTASPAEAEKLDDKKFDSEFTLRNEGSEIELTIDAVAQDIFEQELNIGQESANAKKAFGLLMDAESGEILAIGQSNSINLAIKVSAVEKLRNSVIQDSFEPGSTLKPLVVAAAFERKLLAENEVLDCENGKYNVGKYTIRDVHPQSELTAKDVLIRSSNICMAKIGMRMGKQNLHSDLSSLGFGRATKVELPGEAAGIYRDVNSWSDIDLATHSFGQGVSVTAMQMVQAYSAIANEGLMVRPTLVRSHKQHNRSERIFAATNANKVKEYLKGVIEDEHGTGQKAAISGVTVYGKTGTAQKARVDGKGYDPDKILASFIGFVDGNEIGVNKKLIMFVAVDEPQVRPRWGGTLAAPIFKRSVERILSNMMANQKKG